MEQLRHLRKPAAGLCVALGFGALIGCGAPQKASESEYVPSPHDITTKAYDCAITKLENFDGGQRGHDGEIRDKIRIHLELTPKPPVSDYMEAHHDDFGPGIPNWTSPEFKTSVYFSAPEGSEEDTPLRWPTGDGSDFIDRADKSHPIYELHPRLPQAVLGAPNVIYAETYASVTDAHGNTIARDTSSIPCGIIASTEQGAWQIAVANGANVSSEYKITD